jgi:hypothetical protein
MLRLYFLPLLVIAPLMCIASDELDPAAFRAQVMGNPLLEKSTGEQFCWNAAYSATEFLEGYEATKNPKWLEEAEKYYDYFVGKLKKDPDGCEGWIGETITSTPEIQADAIVGDAVLCRPLAGFAEIVLKDDSLKATFGKKANEYVDLCTRILWEKWNKRGCYYQAENGWGTYHEHGRAIDTKTGKWVERPDTILSEPLNKNVDVAIVLLRLWRITGKPEYRERVEHIAVCGKALFRYFTDDDRLSWSYWTPHGPYDMDGRAPKHWVGVHPHRSGYQYGEVHDFVEMYNSGIVFEQVDFERMIRANHYMAKGDGKHPWRSSDGTSEAGQLWTSLVRWDEQIRKQYEESLTKNDMATKIHLAYFKNVTCQHLNWDRLYVKDPATVKVITPPLQPGKCISLAVPIPDLIETANETRARLVTQIREAGKLTVELLDASGKQVLGTLATIDVGKDDQFESPRWDGTNPKTGKKEDGEYRIRWTLNGESRTEPVWVKPGTKHDTAGLKAIAAGETMKVDFESSFDARWHVEGATLSSEQAHSGKQSLKLIEGQSAVFTFGGEDDLPVKVSMWVFDNGKKLGKKAATGGAFGIRNGDGDKFCARTCWRAYLGGDNEYAWFNTGEGGWYSPHQTHVDRKDGWTEWIFDFSNPSAPKVTAGEKAMGPVEPKLTPKGAAAVYFMGGDKDTGALYVDDISVEYPKK